MFTGERSALRVPGSRAEGNGFPYRGSKGDGFILELNVRDNISVAALKKISRWGGVRRLFENQLVMDFVKQLRIMTPSLDQKVKFLSGGNQQKVVVARWLNTDAKIIIFDEPTRGIDVGSKEEIYFIMNRLCENGCSIIMISSELPEIIGMSDRILVMSKGRITGELPKGQATEEKIMELATLEE